MKNQQTTHSHKRVGAVVWLESSALLAKVLVPASGDEFWAKLSDLTALVDGVIENRKPARKPLSTTRPNASPDSQYRVVRAV
jgi:hypothetical protein